MKNHQTHMKCQKCGKTLEYSDGYLSCPDFFKTDDMECDDHTSIEDPDEISDNNIINY